LTDALESPAVPPQDEEASSRRAAQRVVFAIPSFVEVNAPAANLPVGLAVLLPIHDPDVSTTLGEDVAGTAKVVGQPNDGD
jgi:hypothetical protein